MAIEGKFAEGCTVEIDSDPKKGEMIFSRH